MQQQLAKQLKVCKNTNQDELVQYIILNKDLHMSTGKAAAQAASVVAVYMNTVIRAILNENNVVVSPITTVWNGATAAANENNGHDCGSSVGSFGDTQNRLGYDLVVKSTGNNFDLLSIRLTEFNQDAIDNIKEKYGMSEDRYFVCNNKIYLMEYPIGYIAGFKENEDRLSYNSIIERSQISINIRTGNLYKSEVIDGVISKDSVKISNEDPYYTLFGATSSLDDAMASFIVDGETGISQDGIAEDPCNRPWNLRFGDMKLEGDNGPEGVPASVGRIVLRDYLEATYAPGVVSGESLVVLGRKLRILNLSGSKDSILAEIYDKEGNKLESNGQPIRLYINDFADIPSLLEASAKVKYISSSTEQTGSGTSGSSDNTSDDGSDESPGDESDDSEAETSNDSGVSLSSVTRIDRLPTEIVSEIEVSAPFPGKLIGSVDIGYDDDKPLFYAMMVKKNIFETGLFSGWINSSDIEKNSLTWWNQWLADHGYSYSINSNTLTEFLSGNYAYDLSKEGVIVLDLKTIAKIQEEFDRDNQRGVAIGLRTAFAVLGYVLIAYSCVLILAWTVDVNIDLGFNILSKLSFGRWIAVRDYNEIPYIDMNDTNFVKFSNVLLSCIIIITVGILIIIVNPIDVIIMFITLLGGISSYIAKIILG